MDSPVQPLIMVKIDRKVRTLINHLNSLKKADLKYVVSLMDDDTLEMIREIFLNLNYNTLNLKGESAEKLINLMRSNQKICEAIADKNTSNKLRKRYLKKTTGSGLVSLALSILAPTIASLVGGAISKK